jgi:hypothetical protein
MPFLTRPRPRKPAPQREHPVKAINSMTIEDLQVIAFYKRPDGAYEKVQMFRIDYDEARAREPRAWSLSAPPHVEVIDHAPIEGMPR